MGVPARKLVLRRETLRNLDTDVQRRVDGGVTIATPTPTTPTAPATPTVTGATTPSIVFSVALSLSVAASYSMFQSLHSNCCVSKGCPQLSRCGRAWSTCPI